MRLIIVTPERLELDQEVTAVTLPGGLGEMKVLPGHTAFMSTLDVGVLSYEVAKGSQSLAANRGFVEVLKDDITVLTETCESGDKIDIERAEAARDRAQQRLEQVARQEDVDFGRAEYALKRAIARLIASGR
jgi:F-type H+-transporting ATPase subunit epsilon